MDTALTELGACDSCPRHCRVDRTAGETGVCRTGRFARVANAGPHFGEEQCLSGDRGSGTIFFGACNMRCVFCQNWNTSQRDEGSEAPADDIAAIMIGLQEEGCHNVNLVSPSHIVPQVIEAVATAAALGLHLPVVYNTSAYDSIHSLRLLDGIVDIYMPDFKFWKSETAMRFTGASDYPDRARAAILEMHRQTGPLRFGPDGVARRGVLVRHLVMPGLGDEAAAIFAWLGEAVSRDTCVNVMGQYRPDFQVGRRVADGPGKYGEIGRPVTSAELDAARAAARRAGLWRFEGS